MSPIRKRALAVTATGLGILLITFMRGESSEMFGPPPPQEIDFAAFERDDRPNQFLVAPEGLCKTPIDAISPVFDASVDKLKQTWIAMMDSQPSVKEIGQSSLGNQLEYVQRSRWMRFPDLVSVRFIPADAGRSTIAIFSQSQIGYFDFGVNEKRVTSWLGQLRECLPIVDSNDAAEHPSRNRPVP